VAGLKFSSMEPIPAIWLSKEMAATCLGLDAALLKALFDRMSGRLIKIFVFLLNHAGFRIIDRHFDAGFGHQRAIGGV